MIGERLQELRKDRGLSQEDMARILGVSHYTISSYECDRSDPDDNSKVVIAKLFDVSVDYLLGLVDDPVSYKRDNHCVYLPMDFDETDIENVKQFIDFIEFKKHQK